MKFKRNGSGCSEMDEIAGENINLSCFEIRIIRVSKNPSYEIGEQNLTCR